MTIAASTVSTLTKAYKTSERVLAHLTKVREALAASAIEVVTTKFHAEVFVYSDGSEASLRPVTGFLIAIEEE